MQTPKFPYYLPPHRTALINKLGHERIAALREQRAKGHAERVLQSLMANRKAA